MSPDPIDPASSRPRPRWLVCEDGTEYLERFRRFLDAHFEFVPARSAAALLAALSDGADGVILDLDFRRSPPADLVDEVGGPLAAGFDEATRRRLAGEQGIHILRLLRARGLDVPVLLFADLDDPGQVAWLTATFAPLAIVPGREGLAQTAERLRRAHRPR